MRVIPFHRESDSDYSCIVYWILGDRNEPKDKNTLIDTGSTNLANLGYFMREMAPQSKGIGKMAIEQIILTHGHYDHSGGLAGIVRQFDPVLYSWITVPGKHEKTNDNMHIMIGDQDAVLLHTPGHSDDSICVYLPVNGILFSGDTLFRISDNVGTYTHSYLNSLIRLSSLDIKIIYPGHGSAITTDACGFIKTSLDHVRQSPFAD